MKREFTCTSSFNPDFSGSRVHVYDSTLRDGEQMPGVAFSKDEKLKIARALDDALVPEIEAGFPSVSQSEFESIQASLELAPKGGVNAVRLAILRGRLATINEDIAPVRGALALMEQETLPLRKEVAERGLEAAIRILRETLTAIPWAESIPRAADGGLTKGVLTKPVFP